MRYLKTNTATTIVVGPFLDATDGVTPETALTATNEHGTLVVDNAGSPTLALDADLTASGGDNDFVHVTNDDAGYYTLELTAAQLNYLGGAELSINYATDHVPVFHEFMILPANVYDSIVSGSDYLQTDMVQIEGSDATDTLATEASISSQLQTDMQSDPTQFHVNVMEVNGTAQTANDNGADINTLVTGVNLNDDAITAAKFDESTAFPLTSADTGATGVARTGADGDTLENLSDEIAAIGGDATAANQTTIIGHLTDIKGAGWTDETLEDIMAAVEAVEAGTGATKAEVIAAILAFGK